MKSVAFFFAVSVISLTIINWVLDRGAVPAGVAGRPVSFGSNVALPQNRVRVSPHSSLVKAVFEVNSRATEASGLEFVKNQVVLSGAKCEIVTATPADISKLPLPTAVQYGASHDIFLLAAVDPERGYLVTTSDGDLVWKGESEVFAADSVQALEYHADSSQELWYPTTGINVGRVGPTQRIVDLWIPNYSSSDLAIIDVPTTCGCVAVVSHPDKIPASSVAQIRLRLDLTGRARSITQLHQSILIKYSTSTANDESRNFILDVDGIISHPVKLEANYIDLGVLPEEDLIDRVQDINIVVDDPVQDVYSVYPFDLPAGIKFNTSKRNSDGMWSLNFTVRPALLRFNNQDRIRSRISIAALHNDAGRQYTGVFIADVGGTVKPQIELFPKVVSAGLLKCGEQRERSIYVFSSTGESPELSCVALNPDTVSASYNQGVLRLIITAGKSTGFLDTSVLIGLLPKS